MIPFRGENSKQLLKKYYNHFRARELALITGVGSEVERVTRKHFGSTFKFDSLLLRSSKGRLAVFSWNDFWGRKIFYSIKIVFQFNLRRLDPDKPHLSFKVK